MSNLPTIGVSGHIIEGADFVSPPGPPQTYLGMAHSLLNGVHALATTGPDSSVALAFIAGQVLECALKAYLSFDGDDKRLKDHALRHNLGALWQLAETEGLPLSATPPSWVVTLSVLHNTPYFIRYSTDVHLLVTPPAQPMATELAATVELVARCL
jgi:hypothetical protein